MVAAALLGVGVYRAPQAKAANLYWDSNAVAQDNVLSSATGTGGAGTWNTTGGYFWNGSDVTSALAVWNNANNDTAVFRGTAGTVTLGAGITVGGLQFDTPGYTLTTGANTLTFGAGNDLIRLNTLAQANATTTVGATITGTVGGTGNITVDGGLAAGLVTNTLTLNGTSTGGWSGTTTIGVGQTLALAASSQALLNTSGITLNGGGITLTNTTLAEASLNRISDTAPVSVNGGTLTVANTVAAATPYSETIGAVTLSSGRFDVISSAANTGGTQLLTFANLTQAGTATIAFSINGLTASTQLGVTTNKIAVTNLASTAANAWKVDG